MNKRLDDLQKEIKGLIEKLRFLEDILDKVPCFVYINEVGKIGKENSMRSVYLNRFAIEKTGYSTEEADALGSEYFRRVMHPDDYEVINQSIDHLKSICNEAEYGGICRYLPKEGSYGWQIGRTRVFKRSSDNQSIQFINAAVCLNDEFHTQNQMIELLKENKRLVNENAILKLSGREKEILKHLSAGDCAKKISGKLNISELTVISHRKNMLKKLNMHSTASLVNFAVENGLN